MTDALVNPLHAGMVDGGRNPFVDEDGGEVWPRGDGGRAWQLLDRVRVSHRLTKQTCDWLRSPPIEQEGYVIGKRTLAIGEMYASRGGEYGEEYERSYSAHCRFVAYMVVFAMRRAPLYVLPADMTLVAEQVAGEPPR